MSQEQNLQQVLTELKEALSIFQKYDVIHDSRMDKIEELMNCIYEFENEKHNLDTEDSLELRPVQDLFDLVEDKSTFIKDYISAIQGCCDSSFHLILDPIASILSQRSSK